NNAASSGLISPSTGDQLFGHLGEVVIAGAAGRDLESIESSEVTLVTVLLDMSSSIGSYGLSQAVRDGYSLLVDSLCCSQERENIMLSLWLFNHEQNLVHSYVPVGEADPLNSRNYRPAGGTALYDTWCDALAANVAYAQQLRDNGTPCRSVVVMISDGEDTSSHRPATDCEAISKDLLRSEQFVLAFVGVGTAVDFRRVAASMGVPKDSILVQDNADQSGLREVFQVVSQSAIYVSQSATTGGGFFH
ncbi:MAG: VWA domain-containing protein, partial [Myxococcales bacterium]|nr:VWA domain-containing protein [Myxococcales bacterium]